MWTHTDTTVHQHPRSCCSVFVPSPAYNIYTSSRQGRPQIALLSCPQDAGPCGRKAPWKEILGLLWPAVCMGTPASLFKKAKAAWDFVHLLRVGWLSSWLTVRLPVSNDFLCSNKYGENTDRAQQRLVE